MRGRRPSLTPGQHAEFAALGCVSIKDLVPLCTVPPATLAHRLRKGMSVADAMNPVHLAPIANNPRRSEKLSPQQLADISALGFRGVRHLATSTEITEGGLYRRLRLGWSVEEAITVPTRETTKLAPEKVAELHLAGLASVAELARAAGQTVNQVWDRWVRLGWSLDRILSEGIRECLSESREGKLGREGPERTTGTRRCARCDTDHPLATYRASSGSSNGRWRICRACVSFATIEMRYALTRGGYDALWREQAGKCFGCRCGLGDVGIRVHVDHDHVTGAVRGLACSHCNWTLGDFKDSPDRLRRAAEWVGAHFSLPPAPIGEPCRRQQEDVRAYTLWQNHCMSRGDLEFLLLQQGESCGICRTATPTTERGWVIDHHHEGRDGHLAAMEGPGRSADDARARSPDFVAAFRRSVRGVLCEPCNKGVGHAVESVVRLLQLADFVEARGRLSTDAPA